MRNFFSVLCCVVFLATPSAAQAKKAPKAPLAPSAHHAPLSEGIAAVVNDSVITTGDVRDRLALALLSSGLPDAPEVRQKLLPQIVRILIEEQLQVQEGQKAGMEVSSEEVAAAMDKIAQDNRIPGGDMAAFLKSKGVPPAAMESQARAALMWNKIVMREIRPRVEIGDDEVKTAIESLKSNAGKQEYLVSEIFLSVDKPEDESQVRAFAEKLTEQIKGGAAFAAIARQFSQGTGAVSGGDVGWIRAGEMAPEVDELLQKMAASTIAGPVRSASGYHIIGLREKRIVALGDPSEARVHIGQFFKSFTDDSSQKAAVQEAQTIRETFHGCEDVESRLVDSFPGWEWQDLGTVSMAEAPAWLVSQISSLDEGDIGAPMPTDKGVLLLCLREREINAAIDTDAVRNAIGGEKMERMARGLLRDLRRDAFLDIRIKALP